MEPTAIETPSVSPKTALVVVGAAAVAVVGAFAIRKIKGRNTTESETVTPTE